MRSKCWCPDCFRPVRNKARAKYYRKNLEKSRAYFRQKAKEFYWRNPEKCRAKSRGKVWSGENKQAEQERRDKLGRCYVRKVLRQKGWSNDSITDEVVETMRKVLELKREMKNANKQPV